MPFALVIGRESCVICPCPENKNLISCRQRWGKMRYVSIYPQPLFTPTFNPGDQASSNYPGFQAGGFGGQPFDAIEKVQLTKLDAKNAVCIIETNKIIDGNVLKTSAVDYIKMATNSNPQAIDEINKANPGITENTMQQIDFSKGIIQKSFLNHEP